MFHKEVVALVSAEKKYQENLVPKLERELGTLPEGSLYRRMVNGKTRYYHCIRSKGGNKPISYKYISYQKAELKSALKRRRIIEKHLLKARAKIKLEKMFLEKYGNYDSKNIEAELSPSYAGISYDSQYNEVKDSNCAIAWTREPYVKNEYHPEGLKHTTLSGLKVRSKSEVIIAGLLEAEDIPFRYEAQLKLGNQTYFPDFTILRPNDNRIIYWEHFGMASDRKYSMSMHQKIDEYISHGIIPGISLIMTFETEEIAIDPRIIAATIKAHITG